MPDRNPAAGRFGGPGSSHQDREHPGKNRQETGTKHRPPAGGADAAELTNPPESRVSGGGGERDIHHSHAPRTKR